MTKSLRDQKITEGSERSSGGKITSFIIFFAIATFGVLLPIPEGGARWLLAFPLIAICVYFYLRRLPLFGPSLFFTLAYLTRCLPFYSLGLMLIIPLSVYFFAMRVIPQIKEDRAFITRGHFSLRLLFGGLIITIISSAALVAWYLLVKPNLLIYDEYFPKIEAYKLMVGGVAFALLNAFVEECIYRGVLWGTLGYFFKRWEGVLFFQAMLFGAVHVFGVPNGIIGVLLAFMYGLMLGFLRYRAKGLFIPILTHVMADITIFVIMLDILGRI